MKLLTLVFFCLGLILSSCQKSLKNFDDYFPDFTLSAISLSDGTVKVTATITKDGALKLKGAGFCFSDNQDFPLNENQVMVDEIQNNSFSAIYPANFDPVKTYYFKAWIINDLGFKESKIVSLSNIEAEPVDGPCNFPMNYLYVFSVQETAGTPSAWQDNVDFNKYFTVSGGYSTITLTFDQIPNTGVYTTTTSEPESNQVKLGFINTFGGYKNCTLHSGQSVYVNRISTNSWTFEVCSASYTFNSATYYMDAFFDK